MFTQNLFGELHHFHAGDYETFLFEAGKNLSDQIAAYSRRFKNDESLFHYMVILRFF